MVTDFLVPSLIYAAPLSIALFLFGDRPGFRPRVIDAMFMLWCLAFYSLFWEVFHPIARRFPPHSPSAMGVPSAPFENWLQVLVAPGVQGVLTGVFLWFLFKSYWILIATISATAIACGVLMALQISGELPSAFVWNLIVVISIACHALTRDPTPKPGICSQCNYDLSGGPHTVCPECGAAASTN